MITKRDFILRGIYLVEKYSNSPKIFVPTQVGDSAA